MFDFNDRIKFNLVFEVDGFITFTGVIETGGNSEIGEPSIIRGHIRILSHNANTGLLRGTYFRPQLVLMVHYLYYCNRARNSILFDSKFTPRAGSCHLFERTVPVLLIVPGTVSSYTPPFFSSHDTKQKSASIHLFVFVFLVC